MLRDMDALGRMRAVNELLAPAFPGIAAEIEGAGPAGWRLILTANGIESCFESLVALTREMPGFDDFEVTAFRQRMNSESLAIEQDGLELGYGDLRIAISSQAGKILLDIGFAKPIPMDRVDHAQKMTFLLMDHLLGEYDFAIKVQHVRFLEASAALPPPIPLDEFIDTFDRLWLKLGHTGAFPRSDNKWTTLKCVLNSRPDDPIIVQRNDAALSLMCRADFCFALSVSMPIESDAERDRAFAYEDHMLSQLHHREDVCFTHVERNSLGRTLHFQATDSDTAMAVAHSCAMKLNLEIEADVVFDPAWRKYGEWLS